MNIRLKAFVFTFCVIVVAALFAAVVSAQDARNCAPRDSVLARLAERYGEVRQSIGLGSGGVVIEILASPESGTWTILATVPDGISCLVASGHAFQVLPAAPPPEGEAL